MSLTSPVSGNMAPVSRNMAMIMDELGGSHGPEYEHGNDRFQLYPCRYQISNLTLREMSRHVFREGRYGINLFRVGGITLATFKEFEEDKSNHWLKSVNLKIFTEGLTGKDGHVREVAKEIVNKNPGVTLPLILAEAFAHQNVDPTFLCAMSNLTNDDVVLYLNEDSIVHREIITQNNSRYQNLMAVALGENVKLFGHYGFFNRSLKIRIKDTLPECVVNSIDNSTGKPLRSVITHPVLDRFNVEITEVERKNDNHIWLTIDASTTYLSPSELASIRPQI